MKSWSEGSVSSIQACFDCSVMTLMIRDSGSYITFCVDLVIPIKKVVAYPNNKPLITKETKLIINKNKTDLLYWQSSGEKGGLQRSK